MKAGRWMTIRDAWQRALYEPGGFYDTEQPRDHFRTSVHASPLFAQAVLSFVRRSGLASVTDLGAGSGELLAQLHALAPDLPLRGVDVRGRPLALPIDVAWQRLGEPEVLPALLSGGPAGSLVLANEVLDNVPCDVAELDRRGDARLVEVDTETGETRLGGPASAADAAWLDRWWRLEEPGQRAEIGRARDEFWAAVCSAMDDGLCVAVDYGHLREGRPPNGTLTSYRRGRQQQVCFDGRHDITAHVACDAVAASVGASLTTQRDVLHSAGLSGTRPEVALASSEPAAYLRALAHASQVSELTGSPGLGDFWWIIAPSRRPAT